MFGFNKKPDKIFLTNDICIKNNKYFSDTVDVYHKDRLTHTINVKYDNTTGHITSHYWVTDINSLMTLRGSISDAFDFVIEEIDKDVKLKERIANAKLKTFREGREHIKLLQEKYNVRHKI